MFGGEYHHNIDQKGRMNVPAKLREALGASFVMTRGLDGCIFVYDKENWKKFEEKFAQMPVSSKDARRFIRYFFSSATECEPDNMGRVNIPPNLREHAAIQKEIVTIGAYDRVEIWSKERWGGYNDEGDYDDDEIAAQMAEFGI